MVNEIDGRAAYAYLYLSSIIEISGVRKFVR